MGCLHQVTSDLVHLYRFRAVLDVSLISCIILGNSFIIFAVVRHWARQTVPSTNHSSTLLVLNLFAADVLVGVFRVLYFVPRYLCWLSEYLAHETAACILLFSLVITAHEGSLYTLIAIAVDRYGELFTTRRALGIIAVIWLLAVSQSYILFPWNHWERGAGCNLTVVPIAYSLPTGVLAQCKAMSTAGALYWRIHCEALRVSKMSRQLTLSEILNTRSARAMLIILGVYTVCWAPFMALVILLESGVRLTDLALELTSTFINMNYLVNPFIYAYNNPPVRKAILCALRICKTKSPHSLNEASCSLTADTKT